MNIASTVNSGSGVTAIKAFTNARQITLGGANGTEHERAQPVEFRDQQHHGLGLCVMGSSASTGGIQIGNGSGAASTWPMRRP
jgi:hypothetical protein